MTREELQAQYLVYQAMLANANTAISTLMGKNKKYTYSNVEATHMAETHTLDELIKVAEYARGEMMSLENQYSGSFVKLKNY